MSYFHVCPYCGAHLDPSEVCDCTLNTYNRLTEDERRFLNLFRKADTTPKIVTAAIMFSGCGEGDLDMVEGCTRSDFKRAIKRLRELQRQYPDYTTDYKAAIGHIRREWLNKEVSA